MLMLARRATEQQQTFRDRKLGTPLGLQMHGKTLGIIGMGNIGAPPSFVCLQVPVQLFTCKHILLAHVTVRYLTTFVVRRLQTWFQCTIHGSTAMMESLQAQALSQALSLCKN